ncbi:hypothetical protein F7725_014774 [Dissostichus mawsoni]|uniref:Uncharacterized protein n=1 Tax=Dissostichus mawsoni TaxID=36200 RepID=A0A7J5YXD0_DISMA|nr:hypothetical protein F7725_014774 [Dissostichus mawsoni]
MMKTQAHGEDMMKTQAHVEDEMLTLEAKQLKSRNHGQFWNVFTFGISSNIQAGKVWAPLLNILGPSPLASHIHQAHYGQ